MLATIIMSKSRVVVVALALAGCHSAEHTVTLPSSSSASPVASTHAVAVVPAWHWANPLPQGNALDAVVASPACGVVAVGVEGTILRSTDDGVTWTVRQLADRRQLELAALDHDDLLVVGAGPDDAAVMKIADCGRGDATVLHTLVAKTDGRVNALALDASGRVYLTTLLHKRGRVLCSGDRGRSFSVCDDQATTPFYGLFVDATGRVFVAGGYGGADGGVLRRSADQGKSWTTVARHLGNIAYGVWGDPRASKLVVTGSGQLWTSDDGGSSWTEAPSLFAVRGGSMMLGPADAPYYPNDFSSGIAGDPTTGTLLTFGTSARGTHFGLVGAKSTVVNVEAAAPTGTGHWVAVAHTAIRRSVDDAITWTDVGADPLAAGHGFVDIESDATSIFVLQRAGLAASTDGGVTFRRLAAMDTESDWKDRTTMAVDAAAIVVPRPDGVGRSTDRGVTFTDVKLPLGGAQSIRHVWTGGAGELYAAGTAGALFRSTDEGATFTPLAAPGTDDLVSGATLGHDVFLIARARVCGGFCPDRVFHSADDGRHWQSSPLTFEALALRIVGSVVYVVGRYADLTVSTDRGASWSVKKRFGCRGDVNGVVATTTRLDATCNDGRLFTSVDQGTTFTEQRMPAALGLLFSDGRGGLLAASETGWSPLLHFF